MTIKQFLDWKLGRFPAGKAIVVVGGVMLFATASSMIGGKPDESGEIPKNQLEQWMEDAFNQGVETEQAREEGYEEGAAAVEEAIFGDSLDNAILAELTELEGVRTANDRMINDSVMCRADAWYKRADDLAESESINPVAFLDSELQSRQAELRNLQTSLGELHMSAEQFSQAFPLQGEIDAISIALQKHKNGWLPVKATGEAREIPVLRCSPSTFAADSRLSGYFFQVGARKNVEDQLRAEAESLTRESGIEEEEPESDE